MEDRQQKRNIAIKLMKLVIKETFKVSFFSFILFYLIESIKMGIISNFFNLNILLFVAMVSGLLTLLIEKEREQEKKKSFELADFITVGAIGIVSLWLIYSKISEIGKLAYLITGISGIMIILISVLLLKGSSDSHENNY